MPRTKAGKHISGQMAAPAMETEIQAASRPDVDRLIEAFRSYSHAISAEVLRKYPALDRDDVIGAAELGLVEAANKFDPTRGVLFKTFAYYRIRGAIYDSLRKMGWFVKDALNLRFESGANDLLEDYAGSAPAANSPEATVRELKDLATSVVNCYFLSLSSITEELPTTGAKSAEERCIDRQMQDRLRQALAQLPQKNREVLEAYYFRDETLEGIGQRLGLSKSWLSRLHAKSLEMLRAAMEQSSLNGAHTALATSPSCAR
jgi:RNA polymerase sigma factor FliA